MTYDRSRRDDDRRRQDEKRKADERRRKATEQKKIDDRRRAEAAKKQAQQKQPPKPAPKPEAQPATPSTPVPSTTPKLQNTDLSALKEKVLREKAQAEQRRKTEPSHPRQDSSAIGLNDYLRHSGWMNPEDKTPRNPEPPASNQESWLGWARNAGTRVFNTAKNFGAGFFGQSMDNQATIPVQDAINPQAGEARKEWLERESQNSGAFDAGRKTADIVNIVQGAGQITVGGIGVGGGIGISGTGAGAAIGAPTAAGGAVVAGHGAGTAQRALSHLMHGSRGRLSNSQKARRNYEESGGTLNDGDQAHHVNTDKNVREHELNKVAREKIRYDLDRTSNLEAFPNEDKVYPGGGKILHRGSHPRWREHADEVLDRFQTRLEAKYGSLDKVPKNVLEDTMKGVENQLRKDLQNIPQGVKGGWLKPTPNGNFKISEHTTGQEETG
jgi:hypothetical protein